VCSNNASPDFYRDNTSSFAARHHPNVYKTKQCMQWPSCKHGRECAYLHGSKDVNVKTARALIDTDPYRDFKKQPYVPEEMMPETHKQDEVYAEVDATDAPQDVVEESFTLLRDWQCRRCEEVGRMSFASCKHPACKHIRDLKILETGVTLPR